MSEEKKPKKKLSASPKEHKEPWQAKYATPEEIQRLQRRSADEMRVMRQTRSGGGDGGDGEDGS